MEDIGLIVTRYPRRELEIRGRCVRDANFRSICADYEEAATALHHWQKRAKEGAKKGDQRVEEYTSFLSELEAEILEHLSQNCNSDHNR
jgi:hypothetical protein